MIVELTLPIEDKDWDYIESLYLSAFPEDERRDFALVKDLHKAKNDFSLYLIQQSDENVGFISLWEWSNFCYGEHFAIDDSLRGQGVGSQLIALITKKHPSILIEVEPPFDTIAKKRIEFYQKNGFILLDLPYMQAAYSLEKNSIPMRLMWYGQKKSDTQLQEYAQRIIKEVYEDHYRA